MHILILLTLLEQFQYFLKDPVKYDVKYQVRFIWLSVVPLFVLLQPFPFCIREQQEELSDAYHDNVTLLNAGKRAAVLRIGPAGDGPGDQPLMKASNVDWIRRASWEEADCSGVMKYKVSASLYITMC